ncbi:MAG: FAD-dependent oxidoreductase [Microbacteriaceae bacterium]
MSTPGNGVADSVVIVGGGLAGFSAAKELRKRGFDGSLTIVDPNPFLYDRPPLSKDFLIGTFSEQDIELESAEWFQQNRIELRQASVEKLNADRASVSISSGQELAADAVLLATGGIARKLPIPGGDLPTVLELRNLADARRLMACLKSGDSLIIVGAGLIGAEVASSASSCGVIVTLIDPVEVPLVPAVGPELAVQLHGMHADHGVTVVTGMPSEIRFDGSRHVVDLQDGRSFSADNVLVGIGIVADTGLATDAGLEVDNGTIVNLRQQSSNPAIFAAGDSSRYRSESGDLIRRAEHWEAAIRSGETAAASILGQSPQEYGAGWFWSDRYKVHVEGVGDMNVSGRTILRERDGKPFAAFRVSDAGVLVGAASIDGGLTIRAARRIIDLRKMVDDDKLADPSIDLRKLAR